MRAPIFALWVMLAAPAWASGDDGDPPAPAPGPASTSPAPTAPAPTAPAPAPAAAPAAASLTLKADRTKVYALVYKKGAASAFSHDHVIEARSVRGTAVVDEASPARSRVEVVVSVTGLFPDSDGMREQVGLPRRLDDDQRATIVDHIQAEYQLWVAKYDAITFTSTSVTKSGESWSVTGNFTLRGVTKRITVPMTITAEGGGYRAKGSFRVEQTDFGYDPYYAMAGALQVEDHVDIVVDAYLAPLITRPSAPGERPPRCARGRREAAAGGR